MQYGDLILQYFPCDLAAYTFITWSHARLSYNYNKVQMSSTVYLIDMSITPFTTNAIKPTYLDIMYWVHCVVLAGTVYLFGKVWIESAKAYVRYSINSICKFYLKNKIMLSGKKECCNLKKVVFNLYFSVVQWPSRTSRDKYSFFQEKRFDTYAVFGTYMYWQLDTRLLIFKGSSLDST